MTEVEGTGLGLSIIRETIESLGGRVWTEFPDEGGSIFGFSLPSRRDEDSVAAGTDAIPQTFATQPRTYPAQTLRCEPRGRTPTADWSRAYVWISKRVSRNHLRAARIGRGYSRRFSFCL